MSFFFTCQLLAWLASVCLVQAQIAEPASGDLPHIPLLYPHDLERFVKAHEKTAVTFCTSYGSHCRRMLGGEELEKAQSLLNETDIRLGSVDCPDYRNEKYCADQKFRAYPTTRIYSDQDVRTYVEATGYKSATQLSTYLLTGSWKVAGKGKPQPQLEYKLKLEPNPRPDEKPPKSTRPERPNPYPNGMADNVVFRGKDGKDGIVKLELPGLPINLPVVSGDLKHSSAVILEFNFTDDGKHVMLNGELLALQAPNPSVPALLTAKQVPLDYHIDDIHATPQHSRWAHGEFRSLGLDYEIFSRNRDDPNIRYYNYKPELVINIIGCTSPDPESYASDFLLDSLEQQVVKITFEDVEGSRQSDDPKRVYRIEDITLHERSIESGYRHAPTKPEYEKYQGYRVPRPEDRFCSRWSWRCADIGDPPWYRYIWRQHFDEYGRIGSMRWRASRWWCIIVKPALDKVTPPVWIWLPLTVIMLYIRIVRPVLQERAQTPDLEKGIARD